VQSQKLFYFANSHSGKGSVVTKLIIFPSLNQQSKPKLSFWTLEIFNLPAPIPAKVGSHIYRFSLRITFAKDKNIVGIH
jgi:hypothetical protein